MRGKPTCGSARPLVQPSCQALLGSLFPRGGRGNSPSAVPDQLRWVGGVVRPIRESVLALNNSIPSPRGEVK